MNVKSQEDICTVYMTYFSLDQLTDSQMSDLPQISTLCEYVPLHDPYGWVVCVAAGCHAAGVDQVPMWPGRTPLQGILALSEQLVRVYLGQVLVWVLLWVRVWLGQGGAVQGLGQRTKQPAAAAATHWTN